MKCGFAGRWSPLDKTAWSGTYFNSYQAISKYAEIVPFHYQWPWHVRESLILHKQLQKLSGKKAAVEFLKGYAKYFSKQLQKDLRKNKVDLLYVPSAPQLIAYCKTDIPVIYMTDATFFQLQGYYPMFRDIAAYNIKQGVEVDRRTFQNAAHCMLASEWTKRSAISDYGIAGDKLTVAPLGANLDIIPSPDEIKKEKSKVCRLLFLGVEWERKGGQIALDTFHLLKKNGFPVELTIIGCVPPGHVAGKNYEPGLTIIPFLNKHSEAEATRLYEILQHSDFLLLPTRAECAGVAFCEASIYGVPSITTDTGGVTTYVENGVNGFALPLSAGAEEYAAKIKLLFEDDEVYHRLSISSRKKYDEELNWSKWGETFNAIAKQVLNNC